MGPAPTIMSDLALRTGYYGYGYPYGGYGGYGGYGYGGYGGYGYGGYGAGYSRYGYGYPYASGALSSAAYSRYGYGYPYASGYLVPMVVTDPSMVVPMVVPTADTAMGTHTPPPTMAPLDTHIPPTVATGTDIHIPRTTRHQNTSCTSWLQQAK